MSISLAVVGVPQPPAILRPDDTSRHTIVAVAAKGNGGMAETIVSVGAVNEDSSAHILEIEHYDGADYRFLWRESIAANETADMTRFPVGLVINPGCSITVKSAAADKITVTLNRVQQR